MEIEGKSIPGILINDFYHISFKKIYSFEINLSLEMHDIIISVLDILTLKTGAKSKEKFARGHNVLGQVEELKE